MSYGMICIEVRSCIVDFYFGYVFNDGLGLSGFCYCINLVVLWFVLKDKLKEEGYESYLDFFNK